VYSSDIFHETKLRELCTRSRKEKKNCVSIWYFSKLRSPPITINRIGNKLCTSSKKEKKVCTPMIFFMKQKCVVYPLLSIE